MKKQRLEKKVPIRPAKTPQGAEAKGPVFPLTPDQQTYVDSVPDRELREELKRHVFIVDNFRKQDEGMRQYIQKLKEKVAESEGAVREIVGNQRVFVATAAMQGLLSNPEAGQSSMQNIMDTSMIYAEGMMKLLYPQPEPAVEPKPEDGKNGPKS